MENLVIIATHLIIFGASALLCQFVKGIARSLWVLLLGIFCVPIFCLVILVMLDFSDHAGNGTHAVWYVIFSVLTLGVLPIVTHFSAAISGICAVRAASILTSPRRLHKVAGSSAS